jgi:hypothetical protein
MKAKVLVSVILAVFLSGGCASAPVKFREDAKKNLKTYTADLNGDGNKEIVRVEDKFDTDSVSLITVEKQDKKKNAETIDSFSVFGKIRNFELIELNSDGQKQMAIYFDDRDKIPNLVIYQLLNNRLLKMFEVSSPYGIAANLGGGMPRIKIGRAPRNDNSPNRIPEWESWVWGGERFIRE